jgi:hypothetical protein
MEDELIKRRTQEQNIVLLDSKERRSMNRLRACVVGVVGVTILGLTGCSPATQTDQSSKASSRQTTAMPPAAQDQYCPEAVRVSLDQAMLLGSIFPIWFPVHPDASVETLVGVCPEPGASPWVFLFRSPRPPDAPLRFDGIIMSEQPWGYGDPLTVFQENMAAEEDAGTRIHTVLGVPALSDAAHDDDQGDDPAWLELVLGDVQISFWGGESVEDLIAIAETLQKLTDVPVGP